MITVNIFSAGKPLSSLHFLGFKFTIFHINISFNFEKMAIHAKCCAILKIIYVLLLKMQWWKYRKICVVDINYINFCAILK